MIDNLKYLTLGLMFVSPAIVGLVIGAVFDRVAGTFPLFTVVLLVLGILSGLWSAYKTINNLD